MRQGAVIVMKSDEEELEIEEEIPRCPETKNSGQCVKNEGHNGEHMANVQDFIVIWETK